MFDLNQTKFELKKLSSIQVTRMFFKMAHPYLKIKGPLYLQQAELASTCSELQGINFAQLKEDELYSTLSQHKLFSMMCGRPQEVKQLVDMVPQFENLKDLYNHVAMLEQNDVLPIVWAPQEDLS